MKHQSMLMSWRLFFPYVQSAHSNICPNVISMSGLTKCVILNMHKAEYLLDCFCLFSKTPSFNSLLFSTTALIRYLLVFGDFHLLSSLSLHFLCPIFKKLLHWNHHGILFSAVSLHKKKSKCFKAVNCWTKGNGCNILSNPPLLFSSYANTVHSCGSFTV